MAPMSPQRRILVTSALPYANGHIHVGHLVEYIQTDIWVRFQRMRGHDVSYMCADDTHGTAIMLRARQQGVDETEVIAAMSQAHQEDFKAFDIEFNHYGSTNSEANRQQCHEVWKSLRDAGLVVERQIEQLYDPEAGLFLADRLVKGECPRCGTSDQYGDACESCGATYGAADLKNPKSAVSGATPETRSAQHLFIRIESLHEFLETWTQSENHLQTSVANYLKGHFLSAPLQDWDVSRPAPYFGFEIPDAPGNYWYVWFDAPIGYVATTREYCEASGRDFNEFWHDPSTEIVHFIGKDITYFHALFWPTMLKAAGLNLPSRVQVHGFLTVNGEKMSKSKGTHIRAATYAAHLDPSQLRYYYASRLSSKVDDLDLDLEDFVARVNSDLVGKVVNLASRSARFIKDVGLSASYPDDGGLFKQASEASEDIAKAYEDCDYAHAMRAIMKLCDHANEYVDRMQPWTIAKDADRAEELQAVCTVALNLYRQVVILLAPVVPRLANDSAALFGNDLSTWQQVHEPIVGRKLQPFAHLMARADSRKVQALISQSAESPEEGAATAATTGAPVAPVAPQRAPSTTKGSATAAEPPAPECSFDDFMKVDLRVAQVVSAEIVEGSRKLLRLRVSLGETERTVFAGIRAAYEPESLVGRLLVVVANLPARAMKCGLSEGMALAAGPGGSDVFLLSPDSGAVPGQRVH
jgi:methionyl-tRNA synthetase